jgi:ketosteroid isomerase-like protein
MSEPVSEIEKVVRKFYQAIEDMVAGRGVDLMNEVWDHEVQVTGKHPLGEWCVGWDQVWATWKIVSEFGRAENTGSRLVSSSVHVYGDFAYATSIFRAAPSWGGEQMMCTNILRKGEAGWKIIHHHADPSPKMLAALEAMLAGEG